MSKAPAMSGPRDIGEWASLARTALDDPQALNLHHAPDTATRYAIDCLDRIIAVTDPVDDERHIARCADSLDTFGRHIERVREELTGEDGPIRGSELNVEEERLQTDLSDVLASALDKLDEAVTWLRDLAEYAEMTADTCDDCDTNGREYCHVHGDAWKAARQAVMDDPERALRSLTRED